MASASFCCLCKQKMFTPGLPGLEFWRLPIINFDPYCSFQFILRHLRSVEGFQSVCGLKNVFSSWVPGPVDHQEEAWFPLREETLGEGGAAWRKGRQWRRKHSTWSSRGGSTCHWSTEALLLSSATWCLTCLCSVVFFSSSSFILFKVCIISFSWVLALYSHSSLPNFCCNSLCSFLTFFCLFFPLHNFIFINQHSYDILNVKVFQRCGVRVLSFVILNDYLLYISIY